MKGAFVIVERELLGLLRSSRTVMILVAVAVSFSLVVIMKWPTSGIVSQSGQQARDVFHWLTWTMIAAAILVVPVFPAISLVREVRGRTLELLLNSPLSRVSIYLGKLGAMFGFILLLLSATLPATATCYLMGGLSLTGDLLTLYGFLMVVCLQLAVIGMLVGTWVRSVEAALRWSYGITFAVMIMTVFPDYFLQGGASPIARGAAWLKVVSPIPALLQLTHQSSIGRAGLMEHRDLVAWYLAIALLFIVVGSVVVIRRLSHSLLDRSRSQGTITDEQSVGVRAMRRAFFLIDPQRRSRGILPFVSPVMVKEFRTRRFGRLHWLLRIVAVCAVLGLMLQLFTTMATEDWGISAVGGLIITLQVMLIVLMTPGISGGMIAGELESGGWDLLRVTPLSPARILGGKLLSVLITLALLLCATVPGYAIIRMIEPKLTEQVYQVIISLIAAALLSMLISAAISSFFRSAATATTVAYAALIAVFAGTMLIWVNRDAPFGRSLVEQVLKFNPMAAALNAIQARGFEDYVLIPDAWWYAGTVCVALTVILYLRIQYLCRAR